MKKILDILGAIRPEFNFGDSCNFFDDGMLDSLDLITLVSDLDKAYGISIDGMDILPENFLNVEAIARLLGKTGVVP